MNDERPNKVSDSQLSAMFDNELPDTECELLARRLSRDETLQRQWASYALIGAALRSEPVRARTLAAVVRDGKGHVAERVRVALNDAEARNTALIARPEPGHRRRYREWLRPLAGAGIAASVAALSIFWLRQQTVAPVAIATTAARANTTIVLPGAGVRDNATEVAAGGAPLLAGLPSGTVVVRRSTEPESYTVPTARPFAVSVASAQLANYVVAHSEFSGPLARRNVLAALVASESVPIAPPAGSKTADQASAAAAPSDAAGQR